MSAWVVLSTPCRPPFPFRYQDVQGRPGLAGPPGRSGKTRRWSRRRRRLISGRKVGASATASPRSLLRSGRSMPRPSTTTVRDLRKSNGSRAWWQVARNGPLTRQEVGTLAGVSPAAVSNLVAALEAEGIVAEVGLEDSNGGRAGGLPQGEPQ